MVHRPGDAGTAREARAFVEAAEPGDYSDDSGIDRRGNAKCSRYGKLSSLHFDSLHTSHTAPRAAPKSCGLLEADIWILGRL